MTALLVATIAALNALCYTNPSFLQKDAFNFQMPTYEYSCAKCKKTFECYQSMKDDSFTSCPKEHCRMKKWGKGKVSRLLGVGAGLIFKGSGFYITDYRSEGYKSAAKKETGDASPKKTEPKSEPKTESKPSATPAKPATPTKTT